jgi:hypothetical protein
MTLTERVARAIEQEGHTPALAAEAAIREVLAAQRAAAADWYTIIRSDGRVEVSAHEPALAFLDAFEHGINQPGQSA